MSAPNQSPEDHDALRQALERDAARFGEAPFDAALHHATMRRIRALGPGKSHRPTWRWVLAGGLAVLAGVFALRPDREPSMPPKPGQLPGLAATAPLPRTSAWAYQRAAAHGEEALLTQLDTDARTLLPTSAATFTASLY